MNSGKIAAGINSIRPIFLIFFSSIFCGALYTYANELTDIDTILGDKVELYSEWKGENKVTFLIPILVMAGHADSQGIEGSGTAGSLVDLHKASPMDSSMSDELYWNIRVRDAVVEMGKKKGLNIRSYEPSMRTIIDGNHPDTNWSVGARHAKNGGYTIEVHFDSYGDHGYGSGLIPAISFKLNTIDESLAKSFGRYPLFFRGGLGAPRRGIRILEIAKLEGELESRLRNESSRNKTLDSIASKVINAILIGLNQQED